MFSPSIVPYRCQTSLPYSRNGRGHSELFEKVILEVLTDFPFMPTPIFSNMKVRYTLFIVLEIKLITRKEQDWPCNTEVYYILLSCDRASLKNVLLCRHPTDPTRNTPYAKNYICHSSKKTFLYLRMIWREFKHKQDESKKNSSFLVFLNHKH